MARRLGPGRGCSRAVGSGAKLVRREFHTGSLSDGGVQFGLPLYHAGPYLGAERANRCGQFSNCITDVFCRSRRSYTMGGTPSLAAGCNTGSNAHTEPE
jgi:hypothetical protein